MRENEGKVLVSEKALRELLVALNGPPHYLAEIQALRSPPFDGDNCINILINEFNTHVETISVPKYECHKLDTDEVVRFYEQDFYMLSNFSSFAVHFDGKLFPTSEHAYHYQKFVHNPGTQNLILEAASAHDAFQLAERYKEFRRKDWDDKKESVMYHILVAKVDQHEYVRRKLLATGDRLLVEDSWRDNVWGWGEKRDGQNLLGKIWMKIRQELRQQENN